MKRILMLGGATSQIYAIKKAREIGHYVIICDYYSDNPGQYEANEYYQVSTTNKQAVLNLARELKVDAVVCYASDPAASTAAYVCEKMGFPTSPYKSVEILSNKAAFRQFLSEHGFHAPQAHSYGELSDLLHDRQIFDYPVMVKPVDSSGSKGINKVYEKEMLEAAYYDAIKYSRSNKVIVETFINKKGYQISGDGFSVNGILKFRCFANEFYSSNGIKEYVPLGECWPSILDQRTQNRLHAELQRLITSLGMRTGAYNIEAVLDENDNIYIMELGARNGGSLIPQIIQYATGVDLVEYTIKAALGEDCSGLVMGEVNGFWSNYMVHSTNKGILREVTLANEIKNNLVEYQTDYKEGDKVSAFENSGHALGTMIFRYDSEEEMFEKIPHLTEWVKVELK